MGKIMLVEDDEAIREGLEFSFERTEYNLITAKNIKEAKALALCESLELVLLDVSLPDGNGFDFYEQVLRPNKVATIFLTAKDEENDIVRGLELGAEDYITKPFSIKELMARVKRVQKRYRQSTIVTVGDVSFDMERMEIKKAGKVLSMTNLEMKILKLLFEQADRVVSRNAVLDCIWEATGNDVYDHTVTVYIKRIREKLGADVITTVKGIGYRVDTGSE